MAQLSDMEELASKIVDKNVQQYMREALTCYMTGAYRATIVLSYIALFDDILEKLNSLGKINRKARKIYEETSKKRSNQEVFEYDLINQLSSNNLLPSLDATFLDILRQLRNKAAHPSGHKPSAEEARFIYFESINRFLSKEILSTTQLADELLASTADKNLFPSSDISIISKIVKKELDNIHHETYPYLLNKLLEKVISQDEDVSKNARYFICGMAKNNKDKESVSTIKKHLIENKSKDEKFFIIILEVISSNAHMLDELDEITYKRIKVILNERIEKVDFTLSHSGFFHPVSVFVAMMGFNDEIIKKYFPEEFEKMINKFLYSSYLINSLAKSSYAKEKYIDVLFSNSGSNDFYTANDFASNAYKIADDLDLILDEEAALRLLLHVINAADIGAYKSNDMRKSKFSNIPKIREKARLYDVTNNIEAKKAFCEIFGNDTNYDKYLNVYLR
ncbi:hypothetical protein ABXV24_24780 [Vibrio owensii]|uniref:hypothetical protein n=1 Tax=Vibrio owensii TaxID=696485 RepID=UPI00339B0176